MTTASHLAITSLRKTVLNLAALAVLGASPIWWAYSSPTDLEQPRISEPVHPSLGASKYQGDYITAGLADRATICQVVEEELDPADVARNIDVPFWQSDLSVLRYPRSRCTRTERLQLRTGLPVISPVTVVGYTITTWAKLRLALC